MLEAHAKVLEPGQLAGILSPDGIEGAIGRPFAGRYRTIDQRAAALVHGLIKDHPFVDGNKRTAMTAAIVFLRLNGVNPARDSKKWEQLVLDVAASRLDRDGTTKRLKSLLRRTR